MREVLIVEDETFIRNSLERHVRWEELGCRVVRALASGRDAVKYLRSHTVDIVVSDIKMDDGDGFLVADEVSIRHPGTRVIFLTGHADFEYARRALRMGVADFLLKPTDPDELANALRRARSALDNAGREPQHARTHSHEPDDARRTAANDTALTRVMAYLRTRYRTQVTLEDVANEACLNPKYLCRFIKSETGSTIGEILTGIRIERAKELLLDGALQVAEIAAEVGVPDPQYFSKVFRRATGVTPTEFRAYGRTQSREERNR